MIGSDLLTTARRVVDRGRSGEQVEAYVVQGRDFEVRAHGGEVESLSSAQPRGAGARVIVDHRAGFAYTTDLTETGLSDMVSKARDNASHATRDDAVVLPEAWSEEPPEIPDMVDEAQFDVSADGKVSFVLELERATKNRDPRIRAVEDSVYSDSETHVALATSNGIAGTYARTDAWCFSVAIASEGEDTEVGFDFDLARGIAGLDAGRVGGAAADRATGVLRAAKVPSERMAVVFDPYVAGQFLGVLGGALTGEAVQKGRSLFAGRLGDAVASQQMTLVDDGRIPGAPASGPWDGEGTPTGRTEVIRAGTLSSYLYDAISARRDGTSSTGNAARSGFKSPPGPSPSNLAFDPTGETRTDVLTRAGRAFYVQDFHGVHSGANPITGDFSVGATGRLLENGDFGQPVKEVTIAAPMLDILDRIVAVADDRRWLPFGGSYGGATTLIAEMTIAGS